MSKNSKADDPETPGGTTQQGDSGAGDPNVPGADDDLMAVGDPDVPGQSESIQPDSDPSSDPPGSMGQ